MKLRIKGNSMRLRITRSELAQLLDGGRVEDTIHFSAAPDARLTYSLQFAPQSQPVLLEWTPQRITVLLSQERMKSWNKETEVGIYESIDLGSFGSLALAIEKDFACLDRSDEENADTFLNPNAATVCS